MASNCTFPSCLCHEVKMLLLRIAKVRKRQGLPFNKSQNDRVIATNCLHRERWHPAVDTTDRAQGSNYNPRGWGRG